MDEGTPRLLLEGRSGIGKTTVTRRLLGKMELASAPFREAVMQLLERDVAVVATAHQARHPFIDALRRWPDIRVAGVTEATSDGLPEQLIDRLVGAPRGGER